MDIENMHPFCLPFGLCHDATSSSMTADFANVNADTIGNNNNNNTSNINNNNCKVRSKTSSPSDELFRQLATSNFILQDDQGFQHLDDDIIIDNTTSLSLAGEEAFYSSLNDIEFLTRDAPEEHLKDDDWFGNQYSLLSPSRSHSLRRTSLDDRLSSIHNQVFQHEVDPIDIKSSPTLAQLNSNSSDDPTDGLWDSPSVSASTNLDLLSNCTSINGIGANSCSTSINSNNHNVTCNHLQHQHAQHTHHLLSSSSSSYSHLGQAPACHNQLHNHQNSTQDHSSSRHIGHNRCLHTGQSTCLAVTPFRPRIEQHPFSCCNHSFIATSLNTGTNLKNEQNLKPSATLNQLNQQTASSHVTIANDNRQLSSIEKQKLNSSHNRLQRSASPALVTSSSSPLSSNLTPQTNDSRLIDNKLKENIEYLTALLCKGNKIEDHNQQTNISSTMLKSYSTLAHSLSTGPRMFERQQVIPVNYNDGQHQAQQLQLDGASSCQVRKLTNEAAPCNEGPHQHNPQHSGPLKRTHPEHWCKMNVESSVSAADSTENQISSLNGDRLQQQSLLGLAPQSQIALNLPGPKMLSSLLSKCPSSCPNHDSSRGWQPDNACGTAHTPNVDICAQQNHAHLPIIPHQDTMCKSNPEQNTIPPNGRPITLTPIANQNGIIVQQQQNLERKSRTSLFVQPASPSASSTASSSGNTDVSATSTTAGSIKRQKSCAGGQQLITLAGGKTKVNRSPRTSSLSTDCSLSSHDEGFSSQVDNEDCQSNRDSDDEDDVDSDDESFYGDYTNNDLIGASISDRADSKWTLNMGRTRRNGQKRYFWQYNVQSKGPKGTRICSTDSSEDPFVLPEASDPVFSNDCQVEGVKHSGKARRGDGNDLTPNPRKLLVIGLELKKLGKIINELAPVTDLPLNARNKTRKEKNKLASRACRLKKKAQHEANKIKLYGLQREHQQVVLAIYDIRKLLNETLMRREAAENQQQQAIRSPVTSSIQAIIEQCSMKVAGQTSNYVNSVLEKVVSGCIDGGLQT